MGIDLSEQRGARRAVGRKSSTNRLSEDEQRRAETSENGEDGEDDASKVEPSEVTPNR